jgi:four helix bundle protein
MGRDFRKIKAWQIADDLTIEVYKATKSFPKHELYGLTSQLRRAASSVPANIAEGAARGYKKEYVQFLNIARGSLAETDYFLHLARRLEYLSADDHVTITAMLNQAAGVLYGLLESVKKEI